MFITKSRRSLGVIWAVALSTAFLIVKVFKIGPILMTISAKHGWGIHTGDFLAFIPLTVAALWTWSILKKQNS